MSQLWAYIILLSPQLCISYIFFSHEHLALHDITWRQIIFTESLTSYEGVCDIFNDLKFNMVPITELSKFYVEIMPQQRSILANCTSYYSYFSGHI